MHGLVAFLLWMSIVILWLADVMCFAVIRGYFIYRIILILYERYPDIYKELVGIDKRPTFWTTNNRGLLPYALKSKIDLGNDPELVRLYRLQNLMLLLAAIMLLAFLVFVLTSTKLFIGWFPWNP